MPPSSTTGSLPPIDEPGSTARRELLHKFGRYAAAAPAVAILMSPTGGHAGTGKPDGKPGGKPDDKPGGKGKGKHDGYR